MILAVDPAHPDPSILAQARELLLNGQLVAFPTETVYGLGANALDANAVARIFEAKGRPAWNPVITHVVDASAAQALTSQWPDAAQLLADKFWPGPLTMVLPKHASIPDVVTAGRDAVAVRVPAHPVALALLQAVNTPLAAPSANRFTQVSPTTAAHVASSLGDRVSLILDGGSCSVGIESTIVDLTGDVPTMLRPGAITRSQLAEALGRPVDIVTGRVSVIDPNVTGQRAPGMGERHYAPRSDVWLFDPSQREELHTALQERRSSMDGAVVALLIDDPLSLVKPDVVMRMPRDPDGYARILYAALHDADARGAALIVIEYPPDTDAWRAIRDRLARAAR